LHAFLINDVHGGYVHHYLFKEPLSQEFHGKGLCDRSVDRAEYARILL